MRDKHNFFLLLNKEDLSLVAGVSGLIFGLSEFAFTGIDRVYISIATFLVFTLIIYAFRYHENIKSMMSEGYTFGPSFFGEFALEEMRKAKTSIVVTHFSGFDPKNEESHYVDEMLRKMSLGVTVHRIVPTEKSNEEWLGTFKDKDGRNINGYSEHRIDQEKIFPLFIDFMVFDEKTVVFHFPTAQNRDYGSEPYALVVRDNKELAHRLLLLERTYRGISQNHNKSSKRDAVNGAPS